MFLRFVELMIMAIVVIFMVTQVFIPLIRGTTLLPVFGKEVKLEAGLAEEKQKTLEKKIQDEIEKERKGRKK